MTDDGAAGGGSGAPREHGPPPLPWLLRRVNQRYRDAMGAALRGAGMADLPQPGFWALVALSRGAGDAGDLVAAMGVTKQAVSKLLDTLVAAGFVERRGNAGDRRRTDLVLTGRGRRAVALIDGAVAATEARFAAELGAGPLDRLRATLATLADPLPPRAREPADTGAPPHHERTP